MKNMQNNKSPRNDGLTKEFYEGFWDEIKHCLSLLQQMQTTEMN